MYVRQNWRQNWPKSCASSLLFIPLTILAVVFEQVAIVTGANSGIGFEVARGLCQRRAHVILAGRSQEKLDACVKSHRFGPILWRASGRKLLAQTFTPNMHALSRFLLPLAVHLRPLPPGSSAPPPCKPAQSPAVQFLSHFCSALHHILATVPEASVEAMVVDLARLTCGVPMTN